MFSFSSKGAIKPIAEIVGGELNGKFLYLHRKDKTNKGNMFDEITLPDGEFEFFPEIRDGFVNDINITAVKGSGKTTLASAMAEKMKKVFKLKSEDIIVVKKSEIEDPAFNHLKPTYFYANGENFVDNEACIDNFANPDLSPRVIILDDLDTIPSARLKKAIVAFRNELLMEGRKYGLYVINCGHRCTAHADTKAVLSESDLQVFFPDGITSDFKYMLQKYFDMSLDLIRDLKNIDSRWVMYHQQSPRYLLSQHQAKIFDLDREQDRLAEAKQEKRLLKRVPYKTF